MKNNKLLYLLIIFITLFTFNINVNAAQEMTCIYKDMSGEKGDGVALVQYVTGNTQVFTFPYSEIIENINNIKFKRNNYLFYHYKDNTRTEILTTKNLSKCPASVEKYIKTDNNGNITDVVYYFYNEQIEEEDNEGNEGNILIFQGKLDGIPEIARVQITKPIEVGNKNDESLIDIGNPSIVTGIEYTGICKYRFAIKPYASNVNEDFHYINVAVGKNNDILFTEYDPKKKGHSGELKYSEHFECNVKDNGASTGATPNPEDASSNYSFNISENYNDFYGVDGNCPHSIYVRSDRVLGTINNQACYGDQYNTTIYKDYNDAGGNVGGVERYILYDVVGTNPITGAKLSKEASFGDNIKFGDLAPIKDCKDLLGEEMYSYINVIWNIIKIGIPIILVIFGTIDFTKIIFSGKEDEMKKAQGIFIKRILIAILIFIIPSLLSYLLDIANYIWGDTIGKDICGIVF